MSDSGTYSGIRSLFHKRRLLSMQLVFLCCSLSYFLAFWYLKPLAIIPLLIETIIQACSMAAILWILYRIHSHYHSRSAMGAVNLYIPLVFGVFITLVVYWVGIMFFADQKDYINHLNYSVLIRGFIIFLMLLTVSNRFWIEMHLKISDKNNRFFIENEKRLIRLELDMLKQQIQPHFLFNSLNSIASLSLSNPEEARNMIVLLSDYLRFSIRRKESDFMRIGDELEYLQLYLDIEKIRFGDRLGVTVEMDSDCENYFIPGLILQPLVENAIKYGIYGTTGKLVIRVSLTRTGESLQLCIANPYDESQVSGSKGTGFGLHAVKQKLQLLYLRNDLLQINRNDGEFEVCLNFPYSKTPVVS